MSTDGNEESQGKEVTMDEFTDSEWAATRNVCGNAPDEIFAFQRSVSRINEMQSETYLMSHHRKD